MTGESASEAHEEVVVSVRDALSTVLTSLFLLKHYLPSGTPAVDRHVARIEQQLQRVSDLLTLDGSGVAPESAI